MRRSVIAAIAIVAAWLAIPQSAIDAAEQLSLPTEGPGLFIPKEFFPYGQVSVTQMLEVP